MSAVANTAANRRLTFGVRGRDRAVRHQAQGLVVFAIGLALTSGSLAALGSRPGRPSHGTELAVLIAANLAATVLRFLLFRAWVFPDRRSDERHRDRRRPARRDRRRPQSLDAPRASRPPNIDAPRTSPAPTAPPERLEDLDDQRHRPARRTGAATHRHPGPLHRLWRGRPDDPRWARPALLALLLATTVLYLWNLSASGYANSFYSAAVQAGSESWKAFFFGSLGRRATRSPWTSRRPRCGRWRCPYGSSASAPGRSCCPQVLMGVATAGVLYAAVRRRFRPPPD